MTLARALGNSVVIRFLRERFCAPTERVLVVCTGNTCRSPMAEALIRRRYNVSVESAGTSTFPGQPAAENARIVVGGLDDHKSRRLADLDLRQFTRVLAMDSQHARAVLAQAKQQGANVTILTLHIADPFGQSTMVYRNTVDEILAAVARPLAQYKRNDS
jgi:protein-tyrosine-phosphatase